MIHIIYESNNQKINLTTHPNLKIFGHEGLDKPKSEIVTTTNPYKAGSKYQRSQINARAMSFSFYVYNVETTRQEIFKVFKSGQKGTLTLRNEYNEGSIECYVEDVVFDRFANLVTCQIFLNAPYPYFKSIEPLIVELDNVLETFEFEFDVPVEGITLGEIIDESEYVINNDSDIPIGIEIEIFAVDTVDTPTIYNISTNESITINDTLNSGERFIITTFIGRKQIKKFYANKEENWLHKLTPNSSFLQLQRGENRLRAEAADGGENMKVTVKTSLEYEAI